MEKFSTLLLAFIICSISILSLFTNIPFVDSNLSSIILAVSSIILSFVIIIKDNVKTNSQELLKDILAGIENSKEQIIKGLEGVEFVELKRPNEQIEYIISRLQIAKNSVDDFTWSPKVSTSFDAPARKELEKKYVTSIKAVSKKISYREIFIFTHNSRIEKLKEHYHEIKNNGESSGYSCSYFDESPIPRLQFIIIDNSEVIFTSNQYLKCAIKNAKLVEIFTKYYINAWENSNKLIENGKIVNAEEIENIIRKSNKVNAANTESRVGPT